MKPSVVIRTISNSQGQTLPLFREVEDRVGERRRLAQQPFSPRFAVGRGNYQTACERNGFKKPNRFQSSFGALVALLFIAAIAANATPTSFTGNYTQNFDALGTSGTTMPAGFRAMGIAGSSGTFTSVIPITNGAIASATAAASQTLTVWTPGNASFRVQDGLANVGSWGNTSDRALGTGPTGDGATVMELSLTNNTGGPLAGIMFSYDLKVLTNGSAGDESSELPGYSFFYSTTGGTTAADWTASSGLSLRGAIQATTYSSGSVPVFFATPLTNRGIVYFRWADDNNVASSPDQTLAVDNISISTNLGTGGIYFDGGNDYVTYGSAPSLGVSNFTVECWFKRTGTGAAASTGTGGLTAVPLVTKGRGEADGSNLDCNFFLGINSANNALAADFEDFNSGLNHPVIGATAVVSNVWQHAAVTYDVATGTWVLYLNGVPDATNIITDPNLLVRTPRYDSIQHAALASALNSTGVASGFFNGLLDEVRLWNYARSAADIADNFESQITNAPGLIARWSLDDGSGAFCTNTGTSSVTGTLTNGPIWTTGFPFDNPPQPSATRGPYLQLSTPTSIVIRWRTDLPGNSRVVYGTNPAALNLTNLSAAYVTEHIVTLTNLLPNTRYYYAVGTSTAFHSGPDANLYFHTHPLPGATDPLRVWVIGDAGTGNANQMAVRDAFYNLNGTNRVHAWLQLGDNAYDAGLDSEYQAHMFDIYTNLLRNTVTWPTLGNHETAQSTAYLDTYPHFLVFTLPTAGEAGGVPSGTEHYYSFDVGMAHFICLDSMTADRATNAAMATWLRADLAATTNRWLIAYWHHPPYSKGSHDSDTDPVLTDMRQNFNPILEAGGVDLVLCGHSHSYERSYFINGHYSYSTNFSATNIVQTGSGRETNGIGAYAKPENAVGSPIGNSGAIYAVAGSSGQTSGGSLNHPAMYFSLNNLGSMVLNITTNRLDAMFLRETGATNDWFSIVKSNYPPVASNLFLTLPADSATNLTLKASDRNRNPLTYSAVTLPTNGLISNFNPANGAFTYTPAHATVRNDTLKFLANDGKVNSATGTVAITVTALVDNNANALPDTWEAAYGISDPNGDADGDGISNLQEYIANTNPTNSSSGLRITAATQVPNGNFAITWSAIGGTRYRVSYADDLTAAFTNIIRSVTNEMNAAPLGTASTSTFTDDLTLTGGAPAGGKRFYRVQVVQ